MSNLVSTSEIVVDEVALEGLDGITIDGLWVRMAERMKWPQPLSDKIKESLWSFVVRQNCFRFFRLARPRPKLKTYDREDFLAGDSVNLQSDCPFTIYESNFIEMDGLRGSCQDFSSRELVMSDKLIGLSLDEVVKEYGETLVIVGSQDIREAVLIPKTIARNYGMTLQQYCLLERIGRSRFNGEISFGKYCFYESTLFHLRKPLFKNKLLTKQPYMERVGDLSTQGLLLHLPRFFRLYKPKHMLMIEHVVVMCQQNPNCLLEYSTAGAMFDETNRITLRKLYKNQTFTNFFEMDIKVPYRQVYPDALPAQYNHVKRDEERILRVFRLRDPNLDVRTMWTHDGDDDGSDNEGFLDQSTLRLDISLKEQVYRVAEEAKEAGITQKDVAKALGLSKLNARVIVRILERQGIFAKFMADKGRQRVSRFVLKKYKQNVDDALKANISAFAAALECTTKENLQTESQESKHTATLANKLASEEANISAADLEAAFGPSESTPPEDTPTLATKLVYENEDITAADLDAVFNTPTPSTPPKSDYTQGAPLNIHLNEITLELQKINNFTSGRFAKHAPLLDKFITLRIVQRMQYVEQSVRKCRVYEDFSKLYAGLQKEEVRLGYTDCVCRRTLYRMLAKMSNDGKLVMYEVVFRNKGAQTQLMFICHPDVGETDELLLSVIEKEKLKFFIRISNEQVRKRKFQTVDVGPATKKMAEEKKEEKIVKPVPPVLVQPIQTKKRKPFVSEIRYGSTPKFHRIRAIHEFFFYLVYDYPEKIEIVEPLKAIELWKLAEPRINYDELLNEMPPIYSSEIGWKMFVPSILRYPPYTEQGWFLMGDALLRMPLSIYVSISNILFEVPGLDEMLAHPIRKHYLLCSLPPALQEELMSQRKHVINATDQCRRAACMGLLQFGPQRQKDRAQVFVYLNKYASQLNTVTSEPGYYQTTVKEYEKIEYTFNTTEDVSAYWSDLHSICINTSLGKRMVTDYVTMRWDQTPSMVAIWQNRTRQMVMSSDLGEQPGDGRGAGGLDSSMFAHLHRNWSFHRTSTSRKPRPAKPVHAPIKLRQKNNALTLVPNLPARTVAPIKRASKRKSQHVTVKVVKKRVRQQLYDDVDRQALRKMVKLRVDWNQDEDNLLLICRAAMQTMFPTARKLNVSSQQIRDILHWSLKSFDKTSKACKRRIVYMMKREAIARKVHMLVQEVEQNRFIKKRFGENFYSTLIKQIPDEDDCLHALRTFYVDLVYQMKNQNYLLDGSTDKSNTLVLPDTLAEFHQMYSAKYESYSHDRLKYSTPTCPREIEVTVMSTIIHSSCCCIRDKTSWNIQLYEIYKNYPDRTLSEAMSKVRDDHLISANKLSTKVMSTRNLPLSTSPYHLSAIYTFAMLTSIPVRLVDATYKAYGEISAAVSEGEMPLNRIDGGYFMLMAEMLHHNPLLQIDIGIPDPVLVFDTSKCPENQILLERINNRFRSIFDYVQNDNKQKLGAANVAAQLIGGASMAEANRERRVTISTEEHRTVGYYVSPVERLMKMDDSMFHFYCVLDAVGRCTKMANLAIDEDNRCSFDCVLGKENPVGSSIEIIHRRSDLLARISEDDQVELSLIAEFEIDISNILSVFNVLVSKRFELETGPNEEPEEVTDHGMLQLSMDILRDDQDPNAMNVDMGGDDTIVPDEQDETEPQLDAIIQPEEEADVDVDDMLPGGKGGEKIYKMHDYFFLNPCRLSLRMSSSREMVQADAVERDAILERATSVCVWRNEFGSESDVHKRLEKEPLEYAQKEFCLQILSFLEAQQEMGATNVELLAKFPQRKQLLESINLLQSLNMVLQSGVIEVTFVHCLFTTPWLIGTYNMKRLQREAVVPVPFQLIRVADWASSNPSASRRSSHKEEFEVGESSSVQPNAEVAKPPLRPNRLTKVTIDKDSKLPKESQLTVRSNFQLLIKPWIRINGSLNRRVLDRWMSVILSFCISNPGITIERLAIRFNLLVPIHVRELAEYMECLGLFNLKVMLGNAAPANIWAKYEPPTIAKATKLDPIDSVFIEVEPKAMTRLALFIGDKQYKTEFV